MMEKDVQPENLRGPDGGLKRSPGSPTGRIGRGIAGPIRRCAAASALLSVSVVLGACGTTGGSINPAAPSGPASSVITSPPPSSPAGSGSGTKTVTPSAPSTSGGSTSTSPRTTPSPQPQPLSSSAKVGCEMLQSLTKKLKTPEDLIKAAPQIQVIVDKIVENPGVDDMVILYSSSDVRNVLTVDPRDPLLGGSNWATSMQVALTHLYTACVQAGYATRPN
jgi:hypothetical protein